MLCYYIPNIFLAIKYILYSKLDYIHKKGKNSFTSLAMQDLHLSFFHAFFGALCITFVFKSAPNVYSITIAINSLEGKYQMLAVPFVMKVFTGTTTTVNIHIICTVGLLLS